MNESSSFPVRTTPTSRLRLYSNAVLPFALACCALTAAFLLSSPATANAQDDDEVVNVESNLVVLNVTVTDGKGAYVHGLKIKDFEVFEDGAPQPITTFAVEDTPFAAAVLIDTSGSMEGRVTMARAAAIRFLDVLRADDVAAVYRFDSKVELLQDFSPSRDLAPVAYTVGAKGMTVLHDAIARAAKDLAQRPEKRKAIVVLSDGADTQSRVSQGKALDFALGSNATVYTVDMSSNEDKGIRPAGALKFYANKSGGRYIATPGGQRLREAFTQITQELTNQYTIGYQMPDGKNDKEWRTISVTCSRTDSKLRTRTGYKTPRSENRKESSAKH